MRLCSPHKDDLHSVYERCIVCVPSWYRVRRAGRQPLALGKPLQLHLHAALNPSTITIYSAVYCVAQTTLRFGITRIHINYYADNMTAYF